MMKNPLLRAFVFAFLFANKYQAQVSFTISPIICMNDPIVLVASTGSLTNCSYTWTIFQFQMPNIYHFIPTLTLTFPGPGTYDVALKIQSGSTLDSTIKTVNIMPLPSIAVTPNTMTTCIVSNFPLYSKPVHLVATGGISYTWNPPPSSSMTGGNPNGPQNDVSPGTSSCFSVVGIDTNGCKSFGNTCLNVIPRYNINVAPTNTSICKTHMPDANNVLAFLSIGNPGPPSFGLPASHTYTWTASMNGQGFLTSPFSSTVYVRPDTTTIFTAEIRDSLGCISLPAYAMVNVVTCTGLSESKLNIYRIYPNPINQFLYIDLGNQTATLKISNTIGQNIYSTDIVGRKELDLNFLSNGLYFVEISDGKNNQTVKILKQ